MDAEKSFVTLFPICENSHLIKDLGQIPYFMHRIFGYRSKVVTYKMSEEYSHLQGEVKGLEIEFLKRSGRFFFLDRSILLYLWRNAKTIDVLNLYHFNVFTFAHGWIYKKRNPKGFLYLKVDAYNETFESGALSYSKSKWKNRVAKYLEHFFLKQANLISLENAAGVKLFKQAYPIAQDKTVYLPNGVNDLFLKKHFPHPLNFSEKKNWIITTGRIGLTVKNHEMLLRAVAKLSLNSWQVFFVGPVHPDFKKYFEKICATHPHLENKVELVGEVLDRKALYEWYDRAKIFCLTSPRESFGISLVEAGYFGNFLVGTNGISSFADLTQNGAFGKQVKLNDDDALAQALGSLMEHPKTIEETTVPLSEHIQENFLWSKITAQIEDRIQAKEAG